MGRTWAIIERELRRFRRSPVMIVMALFMPIVQLVILGYAFGGNVKHLKLAIVDQDHSVPSIRVRELVSAASSGAHTIDTIDYADQGQAIQDLRKDAGLDLDARIELWVEGLPAEVEPHLASVARETLADRVTNGPPPVGDGITTGSVELTDGTVAIALRAVA